MMQDNTGTHLRLVVDAETRAHTDAEPRSAEDKMVQHMLAVSAFVEVELRKFTGAIPEREFGQMVWRAKERVRQQSGIVFIPMGGAFVRASDAQKVRRGQRFNRAARRKMKRALEVVRAADVDALDDAQRRSMESSEHRISEALLFSEVNARKRKI